MPTAADPTTIRNRIFRSVVATSVPSSLVVGYLIGLLLGMRDEDVFVAIPLILVPMVAVAMGAELVFATTLTKRAFAGRDDTERLHRLLELPRRIEVFPYTVGWTIGGAAYAIVAALVYGGPVGRAWTGALAGFFAALFLGPILTVLCEDAVRPAAIEIAHRNPRLRVTGSGLLWVRQSWYLPYTFGVALVSLVVFAGVAVVTKFQRASGDVIARLGTVGLASARGVVSEELARFEVAAGVPVIVILAVLLVAFGITGFLLARRQARAAAEVEACLRAMAAGTPRLPMWVATDEIGDLAAATGEIALEMRLVYDQLRAMAAGDLDRALEGDSGLIQAFRQSREGMLELARRMGAMSRGEPIDSARIAGDLGAAFERLQGALQAIGSQAQTIADGDLRRDVDVPGALGQAIQRMTGNLRAMVGRTQSVSGDVGTIVVSLQAAAAQLSAATTEQVAAVTETANTTTEMAQTSAVSADRASELIRQGEAAAAVVEDGGDAAEAAIQSMRAISGSLDKVGSASASLTDRVQRIDVITETVTFLADQSSTLAINAAIEASRAGEAGKGFAVVAREIRALAADSRKAGGQIRELLAEIRDRTGLVDSSVSAGARTIEEGNKLVQRLGEIVSQLGVTVHDAVGLMRQVEGSARQHQAGVNQVSQALTNMQKASESIRDGARLLGDLSTKARDLASTLEDAAGTYTLSKASA